jgi:hypothetical protein
MWSHVSQHADTHSYKKYLTFGILYLNTLTYFCNRFWETWWRLKCHAPFEKQNIMETRTLHLGVHRTLTWTEEFISWDTVPYSPEKVSEDGGDIFLRKSDTFRTTGRYNPENHTQEVIVVCILVFRLFENISDDNFLTLELNNEKN